MIVQQAEGIWPDLLSLGPAGSDVFCFRVLGGLLSIRLDSANWP